jgi:hypothetical protein
MNKTLRYFIVLLGTTVAALSGSAQCANDNVLVAGSLTPSGVGNSVAQTYSAGQYMLLQVQAGANYTIQTCGGSSWDTQLTVYDDVTGTALAYNDDWCGLQSYISLTPSSCGMVRVLLDQYFCQNSGGTTSVTCTQNTAGTNMPTMTAAPDQSACANQTTTIGLPANGFGGTPPYTWAWLPTTNLASPTNSQTSATVTATQTYTLTLTDNLGCIAEDQVTVSVLAPPAVTLGPDTTICSASGGIVLDAGNPGSGYLWNTGQTSQTITATLSGNYSVTVQTANGCINGDNIVVTVNQSPTVALGADTSSCGSSVTLDAGAGFSTYAWSTGGSAQTESVMSSDTVSVTIVDANGCPASDTIVVTLSPGPVVNLGPDTAQCGGSVMLDAGNPGYLYFWSNNTSSQTTTVSSTGTYIVQVVTQAGCFDSDTIDVTINNQPVVNLGPDTGICASSIMLDAGNPGSTYAWSTSATSQVITVGSGTYSVTVTDPSGCTDSDTINIATNAVPAVSAGPDQAICAAQPATLTAIGATFYAWSTGAQTASITVTPSVTTTYYVTGFDVNGCSASDVVMVSIVPGSSAQFTANVSGATVNVTNTSTNAVTYTWDFGDGSPINTTASPSHTYSANGTYTIILTVTGPCGTDTYTQVVTISQVGLQDQDLANTLSLYPNPNDGQFTLTFEFEKAKDVTIEVLDVTGRVVYTDKQTGITSYNKQIGLTTDSGVYEIRIITNDGVVTKKMIIQR